ncbi:MULTISPECIES: PHP-associated domain-containing protein [unclassified Paenibacillus]|uniref:PHP-associated domain-containing protein n=1 Tax=unclassified Paenibacillus TaxID=185978 RepID=UPI00363DD032
MKIDFHTHVKLSKKVTFSPEYLQESILEAKENGLTAITLTEHFNTTRFFDIYDFLDSKYAYHEDYYDIDGFKLFAGMEIDVKEGGHILFIGNRKDVRKIREQLYGYEEEGSFIPVADLFRMDGVSDMIKIGAHPFRESNPLHHLPEDILRQFDFFDLNAKDLYKYGISAMQEQVNDFAQKLGVPVVGGSDTHHPLQFGSVINVLEEECSTIPQLKQTILKGKYELEISPCLTTKVKAASMVKEVIKASMKNG